MKFFKIFLGKRDEKSRKQEKTGENRSLLPIIKKIAKKRLTRCGCQVYNMQACLAGVLCLPF